MEGAGGFEAELSFVEAADESEEVELGLELDSLAEASFELVESLVVEVDREPFERLSVL